MSQGGWEKEEEGPRVMMVPKRRKTTALVDDVPHALPIFDYCYFYWDFRREPLRRREPLT